MTTKKKNLHFSILSILIGLISCALSIIFYNTILKSNSQQLALKGSDKIAIIKKSREDSLVYKYLKEIQDSTSAAYYKDSIYDNYSTYNNSLAAIAFIIRDSLTYQEQKRLDSLLIFYSSLNNSYDSLNSTQGQRVKNINSVLYYLDKSGNQNIVSSSKNVYNYIRPVILFLVMILGMFINQLFEILQKQKIKGKTTINIKKTIMNGMRGTTFWMAILVSPIIFFGIYFLVSSIPNNMVAYFYAFQNGFFWYYIFNKIELRAKEESTHPI